MSWHACNKFAALLAADKFYAFHEAWLERAQSNGRHKPATFVFEVVRYWTAVYLGLVDHDLTKTGGLCPDDHLMA